MRKLTCLLALAATPALAQTKGDFVKADQVKAAVAADKKADGWHYKLTMGSNVSLGHNDKVVGTPDGTSFQLGLLVNAEATLQSGQHEWQNQASFAYTQTKTPQLDEFVKTVDSLELKTAYYYTLPSVPWFGPFTRARLQTAVSAGYYIDAADQTLLVGELDGAVQQRALVAQERFKLTTGFEPMMLRESVGAFARPYNSKALKLVITLGGGAQELIVDGGYTVADNADTPEIEVIALESTNQVGVEMEVEASGAFNSMVGWNLTANTLYPVVTSEDHGLEGAELVNAEITAKVAVKLAKWASLDYVLTAKRIPLVLDEWQVQHGLLLSSSFNLL